MVLCSIQSAELALEALEFRPYCGHESPLSPEPYIHSEDLLDELKPGRVPVMHLHGRVGWYRGPDGRARAHSPSYPFNSDEGDPALLLPDPRKDYSEDEPVNGIWLALDSAFRRSVLRSVA